VDVQAWTALWLSPQFAAWSLATELPQLHCPLLALHGEADEYGSLAFPQMLCRLAGGAARQVILERCGHVPHREYPEQVLERVVQFLQPGAA
jgi:pimeloyl-ACP methyl ester carboxylesterase